MTLLLTLATPWGIHQSSDYKLTDRGTGNPIDDEVGAKQLRISGLEWTGQISFTGLASVGNYKTRDWISRTIAQTSQPPDVDEIVANLAAVGTKELRQISPVLQQHRRLTILVAIAEYRQLPRAFVISNFDRANGPQLQAPLDRLEVFQIVPYRPRVLIYGCRQSVSLADRKLLGSLRRTARPPGEIRAVLAQVSQRAAANSGGLVSTACMVSSLLPDGTSSSQNVGQAPGVPDDFVGSTNLADFITARFRPAPGKKITLVQSAGRVGPGIPAPSEIGEPRKVQFSSPTTFMKGIANDPRSEFAKLVINGLSGTFEARKNLWVPVVLNIVIFEIDPQKRYERSPLSIDWLKLPNVPTVDGAQPRSWNYVFDVRIEGGVYTLSIHQNSVAFRSVNYDMPLPVLGPTEELVMVAPSGGLTLTASPDVARVSGNIEAKFLLRDFPELNSPSVSQLRKGDSEAKVGRNAPCTCGSGRKYKKCCGK